MPLGSRKERNGNKGMPGWLPIWYAEGMSKAFDAWNEEKKLINQKNQNRYYHPREVWWCTLGVNVGFEQDGTGKDFQRPVLILRAFSRHVCLVVPLTTSLKANPYHVPLGGIGNKKSFAIISQVRLIDTKRLTNRMAVLDAATVAPIKKAVKDLL